MWHLSLCTKSATDRDNCRSSPGGKAALALVAVMLAISGCSFIPSIPSTAGEERSGYVYVPLDPNQVEIREDCSIRPSNLVHKNGVKPTLSILDHLPDNTVRLSVETIDSTGKISYGTSKVGAGVSYYRLTADYINSDTVNQKLWIKKTMVVRTATGHSRWGLFPKASTKIGRKAVEIHESGRVSAHQRVGIDSIESTSETTVPGTEIFEVRNASECGNREEACADFREFNVPVYLGIGLRVTAEGSGLSGEASISGIGAVGAEAEAKRLSGTLTVQTIGVTSQEIQAALPANSELSRTAAENAFVAIGTIRAMLRQESTRPYPRVVGLYLPFPGGKALVNGIIASLSSRPVRWCPVGFENATTEVAPQIRTTK